MIWFVRLVAAAFFVNGLAGLTSWYPIDLGPYFATAFGRVAYGGLQFFLALALWSATTKRKRAWTGRWYWKD